MVLAVGLVSAVALVGAGTASPDRVRGSRLGDTAVLAVALLVGVAALVYVALVVRRTRKPPPGADEPAPLVFPVVLLRPFLVQLVALTLLVLAFLVWSAFWPDDKGGPIEPGALPSTTTTSVVASPERSTGQASWPVAVVIILVVAALALVVVAARFRGRAETDPPVGDLADEIAAALADLDALDLDADHRRVVIRTYARMERALGRHGVVRNPSETPQEFLRRALDALGAEGAPAARLTELFEQARFSTHPVDAGMRAEAADALRTVQRQVRSETSPESVDPPVFT